MTIDCGSYRGLFPMLQDDRLNCLSAWPGDVTRCHRHSRKLGSRKSRTLSKRRKELISAASICIDAHLVGKARVQGTRPPLPPFATNPLLLPLGKVSGCTATPMYYDAISRFKKSNSG